MHPQPNFIGFFSTRFKVESSIFLMYLLVFVPNLHAENTLLNAYVKASNTAASDRFGSAVAISGDTAVVGAPNEWSRANGQRIFPHLTDSGAVYVFVRIGGTWTQQAYLKASNADFSDNFGASVDISGDTIIVGAPGEDSSSLGVNSTPNELSSRSGAAYIFVRNGTTWSQQAYLKAHRTLANNSFGIKSAISGNMCVVGSLAAKEAYVFIRNGTTWSQDVYFFGETPGFGMAVDISGDRAIVGSMNESNNAGGVNVFLRSAGSWSFEKYITPTNGKSEDRFGSSVAISGNTIAVGAPSENSLSFGINSVRNQLGVAVGAGYIFTRDVSNWSQQAYIKSSNADDFDEFGESVDISGDTVVFGARFEDSSTSGVNPIPNENLRDSGAAYIFKRNDGSWQQSAFVKAAYPGVVDFFGRSVAVSGNTVIAGAAGDASNTTGVNSTPFGSAQDSGAAYIFSSLGGTSPSDQDGDGIADFMETYFGTSPSIPNGSPVSVSKTAGQLSLLWPEAEAAGIVVKPQWSPDMVVWLDSGVASQGISARTISVISPQTGRKQANLNVDGLWSAFLRLHFSQ